MKKIVLLAVLIIVSVFAFAQKPVIFGVYLGTSVPMGNLGEGDKINHTNLDPIKYVFIMDKYNQCYAGVGFNLGFDVTVKLPVNGLGVFGGFDFFYNTNNSEIKKYMDEVKQSWENESDVSEYSYNLPNFMNLPILFGVNYQHSFNHIVGVFGEVGIGPNIRFITNHEGKIKYTSEYESYTNKFDTAATFGFKIGTGVMLWDCLSVALDYYSLGNAKINGTITEKVGIDKYVIPEMKFESRNEISASELVLRVGYHF